MLISWCCCWTPSPAFACENVLDVPACKMYCNPACMDFSAIFLNWLSVRAAFSSQLIFWVLRFQFALSITTDSFFCLKWNIEKAPSTFSGTSEALCRHTCRCSWSCRCFEETSSLACLCPRRSRWGRWSVVCAPRRLSDPPQDRSRTASRSCVLLEPSVRNERKKKKRFSQVINVCTFALKDC